MHNKICQSQEQTEVTQHENKENKDNMYGVVLNIYSDNMPALSMYGIGRTKV